MKPLVPPQVPSVEMAELDVGAFDDVEEVEVFCVVVVVVVLVVKGLEDVDDLLDVEPTELLPPVQEPKADWHPVPQ